MYVSIAINKYLSTIFSQFECVYICFTGCLILTGDRYSGTVVNGRTVKVASCKCISLDLYAGMIWYIHGYAMVACEKAIDLPARRLEEQEGLGFVGARVVFAVRSR